MSIKVSDVYNAMTASISPTENTVDGIIAGNPDAVVKGIGVTFLATQEIIEKAQDQGINLIISHEGIYFSHWGIRDTLEPDQVYLNKSRLIEECGVSVIRFHDYIHRCLPDRITTGLVKALGWEQFEVENSDISSIVEIPETSLEQLLIHIKEKLGISYLRYVGNPAAICSRIGVIVGYRGSGDSVIPVLSKNNADLVIYGEGPEWEAPEYVRDAVYQKKNKGLIVLGHAESESPGMEYYAEYLRGQLADIPIHYIKHKPIFTMD